MLSDERLANIETLVCENLNEDGAPAKVCRQKANVISTADFSRAGSLQ
jgi:hypothetical protein